MVCIFKNLIFKIKFRTNLYVLGQEKLQISNRIITKLYASLAVVSLKFLTLFFDLSLCIYSNMFLKQKKIFFFFCLIVILCCWVLLKINSREGSDLIREDFIIKPLVEIGRCAFMVNTGFWKHFIFICFKRKMQLYLQHCTDDLLITCTVCESKVFILSSSRKQSEI